MEAVLIWDQGSKHAAGSSPVSSTLTTGLGGVRPSSLASDAREIYTLVQIQQPRRGCGESRTLYLSPRKEAEY